MGAGAAGLRTGPAPSPPAPEARPPAAGRPTVLAAVATAVAAVAVAVRLGSRSLWFDEGITVGLVREPFGRFLERVADHEVNQSAYYLLFDVWHHLGEGPATMRLLSALCFVATVPVVFALGRRLFDARVGALAALLVAVHPLAVEWGQQLRAYALVLLLVTTATLLLVRAVDDPTPARIGAYGVVAAVAVYAHFFAVLVLVAHALSLLLRQPFPRRVAAGAGVLVAALCAPAAAFVLGRNGDPLGWIVTPGRRGLVDRLGAVAGGGLLQLVVYAAAVALGIAVVARVVRRGPRSDEAWRAALPVLWLAVPPAVVLVSTYTVKPLLVPSYLIVVVPALALVAAVGLVRLADPRVRAAATVALVVVSLLGVADWHRDDGPEQWREAVLSVSDEAGEGDGIVAVPTHAQGVVDFYRRRLGGPSLVPLTPSAEDRPGPATLWEVRRDTPVERLPDWDPLRTYGRWRAEHYRLVEERTFEQVAVRRYERR